MIFNVQNNMNTNKKTCVGCFRILSDDTRMRIIAVLQKGEGQNVNTITRLIHRSQPTISHHLKVLSQAGLVEHTRKGKEIVYRFNPTYSCKGCGVFSAAIRV